MINNTSTGGGAINIPIRVGMTPSQAAAVGQAMGRIIGQNIQRGQAQVMGGGVGGGAAGMVGRLIDTISKSIQAAGYGNYTGPRSPATMALTYMWRGLLGRGTVSGMVGRIGATALGFGALGSLPQEIGAHVQAARTQEQSLSDLNRRVGQGFNQFEQFRTSILETGKALGYTRDQIIALTNQYITGVGRMDQARMVQNLTGMQQFARAYGLDPAAIVGMQTNIFRTGATAGTMGPASGTAGQLNAMTAAAVEFGGMRGRENEVVTAIEGLGDMLAQRIPSVSMGMMGSAVGLMTAMNATGNQGLMGQRGMGLLNAVQGFTTGAGGGPRQNLMFQMIQAQRAASGQGPLDYAGLMYQSEEGLGNGANLQALAGGINKFLPSGPYRNVFLAQMLGISQHQAEALGPILSGGGGGFAGYNQIQSVLGGKDVNAMVLPFIARALGGKETPGSVAASFASTLPSGIRSSFMDSARGGSAEDIARLIAQYQDSTSALLSEADKTTTAFVNFDNALTDLARTMMPILRESMDAWSKIFGLISDAGKPLVALADAAHVASIAIYGMAGLAAVSAIKNAAGGTLDLLRGGGLMASGGIAGGGLALAGAGGLLLGGLGSLAWDKWQHPGEPTTLDMLLQNMFGIKLPGAADRPTGGTGQTSSVFAQGQNPFDFPVTQAFGVYNPTYGYHTGVDLGLPQNTSIAALQAGIVNKVRSEYEGGNIMEVTYGSGYHQLLAHLNKSLLNPGDTFSAGQALALSGMTGADVTGPHLHTEIRDPSGKLIDPVTWFNSLKMSGTLSLTVQGAAAGQYQVPINVGSGPMSNIITGLYGNNV